ncbi:MAG: hypothetical protein DDT19_02863 [Syntrophomonadaceae bacterium]|nr:hypothetical protein [Bacillota bacterium]
MNKKEFVKDFKRLVINFGKAVDDDVINFYHNELKDIVNFKYVVDTILKEDAQFPNINRFWQLGKKETTKDEKARDWKYTYDLMQRIGRIRFTLFKTWKTVMSLAGYPIDDLYYSVYQKWLHNEGISEEELEARFPYSDLELDELVRRIEGVKTHKEVKEEREKEQKNIRRSV